MQEEYFLDKAFSDALLLNHFDAHHNTFASIRRIADIYEWGNNVLWPGLLVRRAAPLTAPTVLHRALSTAGRSAPLRTHHRRVLASPTAHRTHHRHVLASITVHPPPPLAPPRGLPSLACLRCVRRHLVAAT